MKTYNSIERLPRNYTMMSDAYEFTMSSAYYQNNKENNEAVFDVFFRKVPNGGGYAIMAGLDKIISYIENLKFSEEDLDYFRFMNFPLEFINYLKNFKFTGTIKAVPDGTPVFPNEPLVTVKAPLIEAQIIETALLSIVNGAMEHATGARRIIEAVPSEVPVMEFGARRADGTEAAIDASIYGIMAGCVGTSNILAAQMLGKKAMGTMAHSFIESFPSELEAFITYAKTYPNNCMLLVDTYNTLRSGVINAIKTFNYMKDAGLPLENIGIRIDSGDLAYLSKEARRMLKNAGFANAKICLSNGLNSRTIENLVLQKAEFDSLGVGDNISKPEGRMGCVYKEVALNEKGVWMPKIKLSEDAVKIVNPGRKRLYRAFDKDTHLAIADIITKEGEVISKDDLLIINPTNNLNQKRINNFELVELQKTIFENGILVYEDEDILKKQSYCNEQMGLIYEEVKRDENPHNYYVSATEEYVKFKNDLIAKERKLVRNK